MMMFYEIAKNIHRGCTDTPSCDECALQNKEKKTCPYEYIFGSMPRDWVFGGEDDEKLR